MAARPATCLILEERVSLQIAWARRRGHKRIAWRRDGVSMAVRLSLDARSEHDLRPVTGRQRKGAPPRLLLADRIRRGGRVKIKNRTLSRASRSRP